MFEKWRRPAKEADVADIRIIEQYSPAKPFKEDEEKSFSDSVFVKEHSDDDTVPADLMELFKK